MGLYILCFIAGYLVCYIYSSFVGLQSITNWQKSSESTIAILFGFIIECAIFAKEYKLECLRKNNAPKSLITLTKNEEDFIFQDWKKATLKSVNEAYEREALTIKFIDWESMLNYYQQRWNDEHRTKS